MDNQSNSRIIASMRQPDLYATAGAVRDGSANALALLTHSLAVADGAACKNAFIRRFDAQAQATAQAVTVALAAGAPIPVLAGLAVSVKDLFDVAGQPTTAASRAMADAPVAAHDCTAVARLRAAGAALVGHTNMSEFAFSGVGINPHFGTPVNPVTLLINATPRIPGGSTSGGAVSVATGAAWAALGSDTGGSIRIPAALQGLVGFKSTQRLVPLDGTVPLSTTLDTACAITRSVRDAVLLHGVLAARTPAPMSRPLQAMRLAVPRTLMLEGLDTDVTRSFTQALSQLAAQGAQLQEIDLPPLAELADLQANASFAAAEAWAWHRERFGQRGADYDPRVAQRILRGQGISAGDYITLVQARRQWINRMQAALAGYDAAVSPTVPMVAPALAPLVNSDQRFFAINAMLLRNPAVVNMLDGCAISLPCQEPGHLPVGLMVWAPALHDDAVLGVAGAIETTLAEAFGSQS
jgi:aspartyl-tRNA(Asn)/glutamyl-tRNA(Gln) amidotransferase subunit A